MTAIDARRATARSAGLWVLQALLAALFLFAGIAKLTMPIAEMTKDIALPGLFLRFVAVCEVLGALGLLLPGALRVRPGLTSLAAAGLAIITIGATVVTIRAGQGALALFPLAVALLSAFVAYGRWRLVPIEVRGAKASPMPR
jgi:uncharacterized membrane protein YphA (DoxX/SURF4 family)